MNDLKAAVRELTYFVCLIKLLKNRLGHGVYLGTTPNARLERILLELVLNAHRFGDDLEIFGGYLDLAEAECGTPVCLALDERQSVDERPDRRLLCLKELDINPVRFEV